MGVGKLIADALLWWECCWAKWRVSRTRAEQRRVKRDRAKLRRGILGIER